MDTLLDHAKLSDPHHVMQTLFRHATTAINARDVPEVIRCFRLTKQLIELESQCDIFVVNAIWTSFLNRFQTNDPLALNIFRDMDPQVRAMLYSPFTFPHYWLRETKISLPGADRWQAWVTVNREVEAETRLIQQSSSYNHYAVVRLRLESTLDNRAVRFRNCMDETYDAPLSYVEAVIEGVTNALTERCMAERGLSYLRIDLLNLRHHPVDSHWSDFVSVGKQTVESGITEVGLAEI
ncbi:MAG TPA: hypothetical protein VE988_21715 [Gemmataceae bacterium]|nr:hypothetical protein [Gemmataceae bacterium]